MAGRRRRRDLPEGLLPARSARRPVGGRCLTGSPPSRRGMRSWPCTGRRAARWSRSGAAATRRWTRPPTSSTSSPTTCRSWSTRITMELANHGLAAGWSCTRSCASAGTYRRRCARSPARPARGQLKDDGASHDELAESWTHIEIPPLADGEAEGLAADLPGCSAMSGRGRGLRADARPGRWRSLTTCSTPVRVEATWRLDRGPREADAPAEIAELLRWLADGHFTFLGYREYDLQTGPDGMALTAVPGTGLGILRHDRVGQARSRCLPEEVKARALEPQRLIVTKANSRSTVHRPSYLDYVGGEAAVAGRQVVGGVPVPRPVHARRVLREHQERSRCCGASSPRCWSCPGWRPTATTARKSPRCSTSTRAKSCS